MISLPARQIEIVNGDLRRASISHAIFDFDGTLSWLRHGWPRIMLNVFLAHSPVQWRQDPAVEARYLHDILSLNGKPSIHQVELFCDHLRKNGQTPPKTQELLEVYQQALRAAIEARVSSIQSSAVREDFVVWNAETILQSLRRRGVTLIILSGTVEHDVHSEADLLGLSRFFGRHIYGSPREGAFSKRDVIDRLMREERIEGQNLLSFGDGPIEMEATKAVGGLAIGVASDEEQNGSHKVDPLKREQLVRAGADAIIPDYAEAEALLASIFSS